MKCQPTSSIYADRESHPSRGAWIEILMAGSCAARNTVAPLTGCVD